MNRFGSRKLLVTKKPKTGKGGVLRRKRKGIKATLVSMESGEFSRPRRGRGP